MLGRRSPQRSLFSALSLPHQVDPNSFYGRMEATSECLLRDDDVDHTWCADNGQPNLPPSRLTYRMLLQFFDDVSDGEAVERTKYDLR